MKVLLSAAALLAMFASSCVTGSSGNKSESLASQRATQVESNADGIVRDADDVAVALDPLTDRLMYEHGFNGAIVSGPDNNAFVILLFDSEDDMSKFKQALEKRPSEFSKFKGQWHFNVKQSRSAKVPVNMVRIKLDVEKFEEEEIGSSH